MYKITVERIDPQTIVTTTRVYLSAEQAEAYQSQGVTLAKRETGRWDQEDVNKRPYYADIPIIDAARTIEKSVYKQVVEGLDLQAVIAAVNKGPEGNA